MVKVDEAELEAQRVEALGKLKARIASTADNSDPVKQREKRRGDTRPLFWKARVEEVDLPDGTRIEEPKWYQCTAEETPDSLFAKAMEAKRAMEGLSRAAKAEYRSNHPDLHDAVLRLRGGGGDDCPRCPDCGEDVCECTCTHCQTCTLPLALCTCTGL